MIEILLIISIVLLIFLAYILYIPIILSLNYNTIDKRTITGVKFFPFDFKLTSGKEKKKAKPKELTEKEKAAAIKKKKKAGITMHSICNLFIDEYVTVKVVISNLFKLIGRVFKSPDRYFLNISLEGGLGPPDLTGGLYGAIESIKPLLGRSITIAYKPDFMTDTIRGNIFAGIEIRAIALLKEVLIFIWKLPKLKLIKIYRKLKKGDRNAK